MSDHLTDAQLSALETGQLAATEAIAARKHVDRCDACAQRLDELSQTATLAPPVNKSVERIGRYVVLGELGEGGMGRVLRAWDPQLSRACAVKLLKGDTRDLEARARLVREAQAMAQVQHPNIVAVFDAGEAQSGDVFMAMELVEGPTLDEWLRLRPRPWREVLPPLLDAARGLKAAHEAGLVHRDFKPHNVLLREGVAKVSDFGLARGTLQRDSNPGLQSVSPGATSSDSVLTQGGVVMGSPAYMAPEQRRGEVDARSDQYAFGVTLFEALHGHRPNQPGPLRPVPRFLSSILTRLLAEQPDARFGSLGEVITALERGQSQRRQRLQLALVAAVLVPLVAFVVLDRRARDATCQDLDAPLRTAWTEGARGREQVRYANATEGTANAWRHFEARVDAVSQGWATARTTACVAAKVRGESSDTEYALQNLCFEKARAQVAAVLSAVSTLSPSDPRTETALEGLEGWLPTVSDCLDRAELLKLNGVESIEQKRAALPLRARLDEACALGSAGQGDKALQLARSITTDAKALQHPSILGEALTVEGQLEKRFGDPQKSVPLLQSAWVHSLGGHADGAAMQVLFELMPSLARDAQGLTDAQWLAEGLVDRLGHTGQRDGELANRLGQARFAQADYAGAVRDFERALVFKRQVFAEDDLEVTAVKENLSSALVKVGRFDDAVALEREVLASVTQRHGANSLLTNEARGRLAAQLAGARRDREALPMLLEVYARAKNDPAADRRTFYSLLDNLGFVHMRLGHLEDALAVRDEQVAFVRASLSTDLDLLNASLVSRAEMGMRLGRSAQALADATAAAEALRAAHHADLGWALVFGAEAAAQTGQVDTAARLLAEAEPVIQDAEDLRAQFELAVACVKAPTADSRRAAVAAHRWFSAQPPGFYDVEARLAQQRAKLTTRGKCEWPIK